MVDSVNNINTKTDQTVKIFDRFYGYQQSVAPDEYDAVISYFKAAFGNTDAAENFAVSLFRIAHETNTSVMTLSPC